MYDANHRQTRPICWSVNLSPITAFTAIDIPPSAQICPRWGANADLSVLVRI
jgi:hypothetical protein